jgi:hypothetical protein
MKSAPPVARSWRGRDDDGESELEDDEGEDVVVLVELRLGGGAQDVVRRVVVQGPGIGDGAQEVHGRRDMVAGLNRSGSPSQFEVCHTPDRSL